MGGAQTGIKETTYFIGRDPTYFGRVELSMPHQRLRRLSVEFVFMVERKFKEGVRAFEAKFDRDAGAVMLNGANAD